MNDRSTDLPLREESQFFPASVRSPEDGAGKCRHLPQLLKRGDLPPTCREVGPLIREERRKRKWSQVRLAEESGITQPAVSFIESQQCFSKLETIERLALALGWEPEEFLAEARRRSLHPRGKI